MLYEGRGSRQDYANALKWYRKAAELADRPEDAETWRADAMRCDAEAVLP